jgi:cell division protein FtsI (penicillin-binding protein 3)
VKTFGFGARTAIDLPGEAVGIMRKAQHWTDVDFATIAFGQGVSVTAIQTITAMSAIANQGVMIKPYVVRGLVDKNGKVIKEFTPTVVGRAVSPLTAHRITSFLTGVVNDDDGTGQNARIENVAVAGKTGTSQKFDFDAGFYSSDKVRASFLGFFPAEDPQMTILVILDEPQTKKWGGQAAAPVFKTISEQILRRFNRNVGERELVAEESRKLKKISSSEMFTSQKDTDESVMPDFRGMSMREIVTIARERDLNLEIIGSGWAVNQEPIPGSPIMNQLYCKIEMSPGY